MSPEQADVPDPRVDDTTEAAAEGTAAPEPGWAAPEPGTAPDAAPSQNGPVTADVATTPALAHAKVHWLPRPPHGGEPIEPRTVYRWAVAAGLGLLSVVLAAMAIYTVRGILVLALVALFIAVSLDPAVRWLIRHGWRRGWAVTLIFLVALALVIGLIAAVLPQLIKEATSLSADLPRYIDSLSERSHRVQEFLQRLGLAGELERLAQELPGKIGASVVRFISTVFGALLAGLTVTVLTIYFMADLPRLRTGVVRLFPAPNRPHVRRMVDVTVDKVGSYMIGNIVISVIAGTAAFLALSALRAPFALPLALVVAITDLIPMIGATLGAVICVGVTALADNVWPDAIMLAAFLLVYQQVENYWIAPRVLRNAVDLPAVAVLLAGLIGGTILGLVGALMAIPIAAVIKVLASPKIRQMDAAEPGPAGSARADPPAG